MKLGRGAVVVVELDPTIGHEQRRLRPCIVVSDPDVIADQRFPLLCVVPVTGTSGEGLLYPPLAPGKSWNQWVKNFNEDTKRTGEINRYARVGGWRSIETPAGTFDAIAVDVVMHLDDDEFWRTRTTRRDAVWYAPEVKAPVREARVAEYTEKGGGPDMSIITTENTIAELVSFKPGAK